MWVQVNPQFLVLLGVWKLVRKSVKSWFAQVQLNRKSLFNRRLNELRKSNGSPLRKIWKAQVKVLTKVEVPRRRTNLKRSKSLAKQTKDYVSWVMSDNDCVWRSAHAVNIWQQGSRITPNRQSQFGHSILIETATCQNVHPKTFYRLKSESAELLLAPFR